MNKVIAVKKTIDKWERVKGNPSVEWMEDCFLCYIFNCGFDYKSGCPLDTRRLRCLNDGAPYRMWCRTRKPKHAQRIINACKRWLKKNSC